MQHNKKTKEGSRERLELLTRSETGAEELLAQVMENEMRKTVAADDVLDAIVAYVVSREPLVTLRVVHGEPLADQEGLTIEMVYASQ